MRNRLRWLGRMALLGFIPAAVAFLSAITTVRLAIRGHEVEVPVVERLKAGEAQEQLSARGLGMRIADRLFSDLPADYVVRQSPAAGTRVKVGQRTLVVLSLGVPKVAVPALTGRSLRVVRIELLRLGLQVGEVTQVNLPQYQPDIVVLQNPPPGSGDSSAPRVNLLVSMGSREPTFVMPYLGGMALSEAQRRIQVAGLRLERIAFVERPGMPPGSPSGTVVGQRPAAGSRIPGGAAVEIEIAE